MDLFGPLRVRSANGSKYILVITDAFTKYTELAALEDKRTDTVAKDFFESWVCRHGVPTSIVSDQGKEFLNETMKKLCEMLGVDHSRFGHSMFPTKRPWSSSCIAKGRSAEN